MAMDLGPIDGITGTVDIGHAVEGRHPATQQVARWLAPNPNLPPHLIEIAKLCERLGSSMIVACPDGPELTAGLRKLLEAKDCFVRARVDV